MVDQNKELIFKAYEALNQGDIENFGELFGGFPTRPEWRWKEQGGVPNAFRDLRVMMPDEVRHQEIYRRRRQGGSGGELFRHHDFKLGPKSPLAER